MKLSQVAPGAAGATVEPASGRRGASANRRRRPQGRRRRAAGPGRKRILRPGGRSRSQVHGEREHTANAGFPFARAPITFAGHEHLDQRRGRSLRGGGAPVVGPRDGRAPGVLSRRPEPGAARRRRGARRPGARPRRRRHRQDPGADGADRAPAQHRPGAAERDPRRHLHQQGGARDEGAHRPPRRPRHRGHALARHLPRALGQASCAGMPSSSGSSRTSPSSTSTTSSACCGRSSRPSTSTRSAGRRGFSPG